MKILLRVRGRTERVEVEAKPFTIELQSGLFRIVTPMHDDWLQTTDFDLRAAGGEIEASASGWLISFAAIENLDGFRRWLSEANAKAEYGYRTMYP